MVRQKPNYSGNESPKSGGSIINSACRFLSKGKSSFYKQQGIGAGLDNDSLSFGNNFNDDLIFDEGGVSALLKKNNIGGLENLS